MHADNFLFSNPDCIFFRLAHPDRGIAVYDLFKPITLSANFKVLVEKQLCITFQLAISFLSARSTRKDMKLYS